MAQPVPSAQAQTGNSMFAHLREMRSNLIAYLEHLAQQGNFLLAPFFRFTTRPKNGLPVVVHSRKGN